MPYPGGKHAPGHYVSGGGVSDLIFLKGVGTSKKILNGSNPAQLLDFPAGRSAGDILFVHQCKSAGGFLGPVEGFVPWPDNLNLGGNQENLWWRTATADANDNFTVPANANQTIITQMACFISPFSLKLLQSTTGFNGSTKPDFPYEGITAEGGGTPDTLYIAPGQKFWNPVLPSPLTAIGGPNGAVNIIDSSSLVDNIPSNDSLLFNAWLWKFFAVDGGVPASDWTETDPSAAPQGGVLGQGFRFEDVANP